MFSQCSLSDYRLRKGIGKGELVRPRARRPRPQYAGLFVHEVEVAFEQLGHAVGGEGGGYLLADIVPTADIE